MSSVSLSHLILFVAALIIAAGVGGVIISEADQFSGVIEDRGSGVAEEVETDVTIISDAGSEDSVWDEDDEEITVLVQNTGSKHLTAVPNEVDPLVDGEYVPSDRIEIERADGEDSTAWPPGEVIELTITDPPDVDGDTTVVVIVNGNEAEFEFFVP